MHEPVAKYWPDFAQNGKEHVTVTELLSHQCGLGAIDVPLTFDILADPAQTYAACAAQKMEWDTPGDHHGYMPITLGWYESALVHYTDPARRSIGRFLQA